MFQTIEGFPKYPKKKNRKHKRKILLPTKSEKEKHWKPIASKLISKPKPS